MYRLFQLLSLILLIVCSSDSAGGHLLENGCNSTTHLYLHLKDYFLKWYMPLALVIGIFGTCFCLIFLFMCKLFPPNMLLWLVSICVGDFFILTFEGMWIFIKIWFNFDIRDINLFMCRMHSSASNYFFYWSAYMQCFLSIERSYIILQPLKARSNSNNLKKCIFIQCITSLLLIIPMLPYLLKWEVRNKDCDPVDEGYYRITSLCDMIIWGVLPLLGMSTSTIIIIWNMCRANSMITINKQEKNAQKEEKYCCRTNRYSTGNLLRNTLAVSKKTVTVTCQRHGAPDNSGHVTTLLICMNLWYMISNYPYLIYLMYLNFSNNYVSSDMHKFFYYFSRSLCFLNSSSNWLFYCVAGKVFRRKATYLFKKIFCFNEDESKYSYKQNVIYKRHLFRYPSNGCGKTRSESLVMDSVAISNEDSSCSSRNINELISDQKQLYEDIDPANNSNNNIITNHNAHYPQSENMYSNQDIIEQT